MTHMPLSPNERGDDRPYYAPVERQQCSGCLEYFTELALDAGCTCDHNALCAECAKGYSDGEDNQYHPVDTRALRAEIAKLEAEIRIRDAYIAEWLRASAAIIHMGAEARRIAGMEVE